MEALRMMVEDEAASNHSIPFILVSESWFKSYNRGASVAIPGYSLHRADRDRRIGGGVALYAHENLPATSTLQFDNSQFNTMAPPQQQFNTMAPPPQQFIPTVPPPQQFIPTVPPPQLTYHTVPLQQTCPTAPQQYNTTVTPPQPNFPLAPPPPEYTKVPYPPRFHTAVPPAHQYSPMLPLQQYCNPQQYETMVPTLPTCLLPTSDSSPARGNDNIPSGPSNPEDVSLLPNTFNVQSTTPNQPYSSLLLLNAGTGGLNTAAGSKNEWKMEALRMMVEDEAASNHSIPFILVSESWFKSYNRGASVAIPGYSLHRADRDRRIDDVTIVLGGDLNFPEIDWDSQSLNFNNRGNSGAASALFELMSEFFLTQVVDIRQLEFNTMAPPTQQSKPTMPPTQHLNIIAPPPQQQLNTMAPPPQQFIPMVPPPQQFIPTVPPPQQFIPTVPPQAPQLTYHTVPPQFHTAVPPAQQYCNPQHTMVPSQPACYPLPTPVQPGEMTTYHQVLAIPRTSPFFQTPSMCSLPPPTNPIHPFYY
eukprot:sb/3463776/